MNQSLGIARSGIHAFQQSLDAIAHDIANVNTTAYKAKQVEFEGLLENTQTANGKLLFGNNLESMQISSGVKSRADSAINSMGSFSSASGSRQLAIAGEGFFKITDRNGQSYLTRDGSFHLNPDRSITNAQGDKLELEPDVFAAGQWPEGELLIQEDGSAWIETKNSMVAAGRIPLYRLREEGELTAAGENKYLFPGEGAVISSLQNPAGFGKISQQYVENSNVDLAAKMSEMIVTQRAYALNVKAAQSTDEMMGIINNFKQ